MKKWFSELSMDELACTEHQPQPHPTSFGGNGKLTAGQALSPKKNSLLDLTNALVSEWEQIPAVSFQNLVESLKRQEWRLLYQQIHGMRLLRSIAEFIHYGTHLCGTAWSIQVITLKFKLCPWTQLPATIVQCDLRLSPRLEARSR